MKFEEINKIYTQIVTEYITKGYYINAGTMGGSQGQVASIDLTDGNKIIRVLINKFSDRDYRTNGVEIIVGESTDKAEPNNAKDYYTIWNDNLKIIDNKKFYQISRNNENYFGTKEEAEKAYKKNIKRWREHRDDFLKEKTLPEAAKKIVLNWVKKQPKCKSIKISDIERVYTKTEKFYDGTQKKNYYVTAKGKTYKMA